MTIVAIAHRLSTVRDADRIVVLNHGRIAELGTHGELMAIEAGLYQRLYLLQQLQDDSEQGGALPPLAEPHRCGHQTTIGVAAPSIDRTAPEI